MSEESKAWIQATLEMLEKAKADGVSTVFDRAEEMKPCPIGAEGSCCKNCAMGPCRVPAPKKKAETRGGEGQEKGSLRGHGRDHLGPKFRPHDRRRNGRPLRPCPGSGRGFSWPRPRAKSPGLRSRTSRSSTRWPWIWGWKSATAGQGDRHRGGREVPGRVRKAAGRASLRQTGAPEAAGNLAKAGNRPPGHRPGSGGADAPHPHGGGPGLPESASCQGSRCALADGWGGSMISTELQDILFGNPVPIAGKDQPGRPQGGPGEHHHARP